MAYRTTCPKCGAKDRLTVTSGTFSALGIPLTEDGFSFGDAKQVDTYDEEVHCAGCDKFFALAEVTTDD